MKIVAPKKDIVNIIINRYVPNSKIIFERDFESCLEKINNNQADVCLIPVVLAHNIINKYSYKDLEVTNISLPEDELSYVCNDENFLNQMNLCFAQMLTDGTYAQIYSDWLEVKTPNDFIYMYLRIILLLLFIMFIVSSFFHLYFKRKYKKSTSLVREMKENLSLALDAGEMAAWRYDVDSRIFTTIHGDFLNTGSISLNDLKELVHPADQNILWESLEELISESKDKNVSAARLKIKGEWRWFNANMIASKDKNGHIKYITGTRKDVTDLKILLLNLENAKLKAEESDRLKSAFLANMSYEIRTPLNAIVGFSELLIDTSNKEEKENFVKIISTNSNLLIRLIADILDLSKIESGTFDILKKPVDMIEFFNRDYLICKNKLLTSDVELVSDCKLKKCVVVLDENRMSQIGNNFISNAIKYTTSGSITLGLDYINAGIKIYVKDTGIGIPYEKLGSHIQGTGLGLSICQAVVKSLNGKIGLESEVGKGTTFWAWVPCELIKKEE